MSIFLVAKVRNTFYFLAYVSSFVLYNRSSTNPFRGIFLEQNYRTQIDFVVDL